MKDNGIFNILFLSNMREEKGVYTLLEACSILEKKKLSFSCHFVGKWSDIAQEVFYSKIKEYGIFNCVKAYGAKYGSDKLIYFKQASLFVFPTFYHNECFPVVLLEAIEQGLACIATNEGGIPDVIDEGITGYIVEKKNAIVLADKIEFLIKNPNLCRKMGEAGKKKFLEKFTLDKFENRLKDILLDILKAD